MVVVKGFGERPMLLLTTLAGTTSRKSWQVVEGYLTRWRVEDASASSSRLQPRGHRVLTYRRLKNMVALLLAVIYFNCVWLAGRLRYETTTNITHAKRIYGVAEFLHYAIADGLRALHAPREMVRLQAAPRIKPARTGLSGMTRFLGKLLPAPVLTRDLKELLLTAGRFDTTTRPCATRSG